MRDCGNCKAKPGDFHVLGCSVERCVRCGGQAIGCHCIYEVLGSDVENMEVEHPAIFFKGPTPDMHERFDAFIDRAGGRLPWTGEYPGSAACREFGFWCYWDETEGWVQCDRGHPKATEDLNHLVTSARWDAAKRAWVWRGKSSP